jgi:cytochrome c biogenesis protein CcdA
MAARGENLGEVAATMLAFGLGAAAPLALLGMLSREALMRWRGRMLSAGAAGKQALGAALLLVGGAILLGLDKRAEVWLIEVSPDWLTRLTTTF